MPTPFVHGLLPGSCLATSPGALPPLSRPEWLRFFVVAFVLGNAPDLDLVPALFSSSLWFQLHRNLGHNVFAVALLIAAGRWALCRWVSPRFPSGLAWRLSAFLVLSHLVLDTMSERDLGPHGHTGGVPLFWPLSDYQLHSPLKLFPTIEYDERLHPAVGLARSAHYWTQVVWLEVAFCAAALVTWTTGWRLAQKARRRLERSRAPHGRTA